MTDCFNLANKSKHQVRQTSFLAAISCLSLLLASCTEASVDSTAPPQPSVKGPDNFAPLQDQRAGLKTVVPRQEKPKVEAKWVTTKSGLQYQDIEEGWGLSPTRGFSVLVHYTGYLENGSKFESSLDKGIPFYYIYGSGKVIKGFEESLSGMKVGGVRKVIIPPSLGYGAEGHGSKIPPNATLLYEIKLLSANR